MLTVLSHGARLTARSRPAQVALGLVADRLLGEPPVCAHPVVLFGSAMTGIERRLWRDARPAGVAHAAVGALLGVCAGALVRSTPVATYVASCGRTLRDTAATVADALAAEDLPRAREALTMLVGRDTSELSPREIARATVESVAENTVDAIVAPAVWALWGGAPGALLHRASNTMDAMVGYRSERYVRYGWAAARLDDVLAWVPARLTAVLTAAVHPARAIAVWRIVRRDARDHPSPNAGVAEAAFAAALGVRLGGTAQYGGRVEVRPDLGDGLSPDRVDIERAISTCRRIESALITLLFALAFAEHRQPQEPVDPLRHAIRRMSPHAG